MSGSRPLGVVWAKTGRDECGRVREWLPLVQHLDDAGGVAAHLFDNWLPSSTRRVLALPFSGDEEQARAYLAFLAGVHDVGKASPAFAVQVDVLADRMRAAGLTMPATLPADERRKARHELVGAMALERWLRERFAWSADAAASTAVIVGGHHGVPPDVGDARRARGFPHLLGDVAWHDVRTALLERAAERHGVVRHLPAWTSLALSQPVLVLLTAVVIVADWIASNGELFPLASLDDEDPSFSSSRRSLGLANLELPAPWQPSVPSGDADALLASRFHVPAGASAWPIQHEALEAARSMTLPGLLVVESETGSGKTEAALLAAEVLAARTGAGGCFVALPTQATTDAMFSRVLSWLVALPDARLASDARRALPASMQLAHGKASLNAVFRELRLDSTHDIAADAAGGGGFGKSSGGLDPVVHSWLSGRKKGPLADFVVGTIDQVLFAGLKARHLALRHLGLARKVVILDEVHAFDAYMDVYLARVLEWLGAYGVPVVLLSATRPAQLRARLCAAYQAGVASTAQPRRVASPRRPRSWLERPATPQPGQVEAGNRDVDLAGRAGHTAYPSLTTLHAGVPTTVPVESSERSLRVRLETSSDDLGALEDLLGSALRDGGCALVVRNTVRRAQETARSLAATLGEDTVTVAHSRFLGHDRVARDSWLRDTFGPPSSGGMTPSRPDRHVVVATQVIEQSLDVDFDLLVTDLAPADLLLQRIGRLHRHPRGPGENRRPNAVRAPKCIVVGVTDWASGPPEPVRGSVKVYDRHTLYRAAALLLEITSESQVLRIPEDVAPFVQRAYADEPVGSPQWQSALDDARRDHLRSREQQESRAAAFLLGPPRGPGAGLLGWLHGDVGEADDSAQGQCQVRDAEFSVEVLVLQRDTRGVVRIPDWVTPHGGRPLPMNEPPRGSLARAAAGCALRLPAYLTIGQAGDRLIAALERNYLPELQRSPLLAGQLLLLLDDDGRGTYDTWQFSYDQRFGLEVASA